MKTVGSGQVPYDMQCPTCKDKWNQSEMNGNICPDCLTYGVEYPSEIDKLELENVQLRSQLTILRIELAHLKAKDSNINFP